MANRNDLFWEIQTRIAHPIPARVWLSLSLPDEIAPLIRMSTEPYAPVGLSPQEARDLASALTEAADLVDEAAEATGRSE